MIPNAVATTSESQPKQKGELYEALHKSNSSRRRSFDCFVIGVALFILLLVAKYEMVRALFEYGVYRPRSSTALTALFPRRASFQLQDINGFQIIYDWIVRLLDPGAIQKTPRAPSA